MDDASAARRATETATQRKTDMPAWTGRYIGVELEFNEISTQGEHVTTHDVARAVETAGVPARAMGWGGTSGTGNVWDCKTDGSAGSTGGTGNEVASPKIMLDAQGHNDDLRKVCEALSSIGARVNKYCGLHVHVDCSDFTMRDLQALIALWARYEPFFYSQVAPSRGSNSYCMPLRAATWQNTTQRNNLANVLNASSDADIRGAAQANIGAKYQGLNLRHFWNTKRVEFRLHHGTIEYDKIRMFAMQLAALVARVKNAAAPPLSRRIEQPRADVGFRPAHVLAMIGICASTWTEGSALADAILAHVEERIATHAETAQRAARNAARRAAR